MSDNRPSDALEQEILHWRRLGDERMLDGIRWKLVHDAMPPEVKPLFPLGQCNCPFCRPIDDPEGR